MIRFMPTREKAIEQGAAFYQGVSPGDEPCLSPATRHCERCGAWLCVVHFRNPEWHACAENEAPETA